MRVSIFVVMHFFLVEIDGWSETEEGCERSRGEGRGMVEASMQSTHKVPH